MISLKQSNKILEYFDKIITDPKPELNYQNEFQLLIAVVLSAQTTDKAVNKITAILFDKYKGAEELSKANINDLEEIIKSIGLYKNKARYIKSIADEISKKGDFPKNRKELESLPGVGRKTANVILSVLNIEPAFAVDTHILRVSKRLGIANSEDSVRKVEEALKKTFDISKWNKLHHQFLLFGRYTCKALKPNCAICELKGMCSYYNKSLKNM
ncbi:endonuclease III [Acholeplasma sp. OttesenSCG-928-E16]|nr:endonuclease III [Acholeplasma sp. OttesenSCG-928-E16]